VAAHGEWSTQDSNPESGEYAFDVCPGDGDELDVFTADPEKNRAYAVIWTSCAGHPQWKDAQTYFSTDTSYVRTYVNQYGETAKEYRSAELGSSISDSWFTSCSGKRETPGTFSVVLDSSGVSLAAGDCNN